MSSKPFKGFLREKFANHDEDDGGRTWLRGGGDPGTEEGLPRSTTRNRAGADEPHGFGDPPPWVRVPRRWR